MKSVADLAIKLGLISTSLKEGFDYPVAQALAQGKPVIYLEDRP